MSKRIKQILRATYVWVSLKYSVANPIQTASSIWTHASIFGYVSCVLFCNKIGVVLGAPFNIDPDIRYSYFCKKQIFYARYVRCVQNCVGRCNSNIIAGVIRSCKTQNNRPNCIGLLKSMNTIFSLLYVSLLNWNYLFIPIFIYYIFFVRSRVEETYILVLINRKIMLAVWCCVTVNIMGRENVTCIRVTAWLARPAFFLSASLYG